MSTNPTFVRLNDAASRGSLADIGGTGWSISGNDVLRYPENMDEARFVRNKLRLGVLEEASQAEHEEVHPEDYSTSVDDIPRVMFVSEPTHQEGQVMQQAEAQARRIAAARSSQTSQLYGEDSPVTAQPGMAGGQSMVGSMMGGGFATPGVPSPGDAAMQRGLSLAEDDEYEDEEDADEDGDDDVKPYLSWKKAELVAEADKRELDTSGTKEDLAVRLESDDESEEDEDEDEG